MGTALQFLIVLAILLAVVLIVTGPLRRQAADPGASGDHVPPESASGRLELESRLADLEAAREAKYREIRDAKLDHDTGKLSRADYEAVDGKLRGEALEILREIDALQPVPDAGSADPE